MPPTPKTFSRLQHRVSSALPQFHHTQTPLHDIVDVAYMHCARTARPSHLPRWSRSRRPRTRSPQPTRAPSRSEAPNEVELHGASSYSRNFNVFFGTHGARGTSSLEPSRVSLIIPLIQSTRSQRHEGKSNTIDFMQRVQQCSPGRADPPRI